MAKELIHEILPVGMLQCNCQIIGDPETHEAIVIDPGDEVDRILEILKIYNLKVLALVNTHAHIDHVGGLQKMRLATGAPVMMHQEDLELYRNIDMQASWLGVRPPEMTDVDSFLSEGDKVRWGKYEVNVLHTPGHTKGSISLYLPFELLDSSVPAADARKKSHALAHSPILFAGDTLFAGSIGRTDLWGGSTPQILSSIHHKILSLPDDTVVYPGHGPATTIGDERESNPFLTRR
jgi:glyoxylase-like metal-dependent hydrolase (beta-lactamase superfamily II)